MDKAMNLIPSPEWSDAKIQEYFDQTAKLTLKYGLTSIHDAATDSRAIASTEYWGNNTVTYPKLHNYGKHGRLNFRAVKMFTDGAPSSLSCCRGA